MHSSTSGLRTRQRTFTSCTECRRRKQRCNQAKDRPCNNCARRYPPVDCTYESSSPPPTVDTIMDFRDDQDSRQKVPGPGPAYVETSQSSVTIAPTTTASEGYYTSPYGYYSAPVTRSDYDYPSDSSGTAYNAYSSSASYAPVSAGYYQSVPTSYSTPVTTGGYYSSPEEAGAWLSTGDPATFAGVGSTEYYYVTNPDPGNQGHASSGP